MIINPKIFKNIIFAVYFLVTALSAQDLEDLSFGDENSLDIATWNIEWFPKNNQITVNYVTDIITLLDLDVLAIQELDDTDMFEQMLDSLTAYTGYYESNWFAGLLLCFLPLPACLPLLFVPPIVCAQCAIGLLGLLGKCIKSDL